MSVEVSIVMNSYNKYPQNLYTLQSLKYQTFDPSKMEVIFVDDASTDRTPKLNGLRTPYPFHYIRMERNVGRSEAKNIGIRTARGKVIIVMDAEMLVHPRLVEMHHRYHSLEDRLVVTGCLRHHGLFSVLHPAFNHGQFARFYSLIRKRPSLRRKFRLTSKKTRLNVAKISARVRKTKKPMRLLTEWAIKRGTYRKYAFPDPLRGEVLRQFGQRYEGYHFPWYCVVTHCISVRKSLFDEVGPFYEGFEGWGFEDWEFGYRLHQAGAKFLDDVRAPVYHQEHPVKPYSSIRMDNLKNYQRFLNRHRDFAVGVHTMLLLGLRDFVSVNGIMTDYKAMAADNPEAGQTMHRACLVLFDSIAQRLVEQSPIENLAETLQRHDAKLFRNFSSRLDDWRNSGRYPQFTAGMDELLAYRG